MTIARDSRVTDYRPERRPSVLATWTGKVYDMANVRCSRCGRWIGVSGFTQHYGSSGCRL